MPGSAGGPSSPPGRRRPRVDAVGAGTGAAAGGLQGGVGTASARVTFGGADESSSSVRSPSSTPPARCSIRAPGCRGRPEGFRLRRPSQAERASLLAVTTPSEPLNTTIGVIATSGRLTKAEVSKLASVGHDGIARAVRPSHSMFDGDTIFAMATGDHEIDTGASTAVGREGWPTERGVSYRGPDTPDLAPEPDPRRRRPVLRGSVHRRDRQRHDDR